jgi:glycosyltransferase involved in cell wall biosynthesis
MKVAILAPEFIPTWGGVGIYTVELVKELASYKDMDVHVITPCRNDVGEKEVLKELGKPKNVHIHQISTANDTFFYNFKFQVALK